MGKMEILDVTFPLSGVKTYILIPPLVAFGISFFTSMGGISGAFLLLPFQMSVLGFTSPSVTSTNFLFNVAGTPGGVYRYARERRFIWPMAILIVTGIIPGVLVGYYLRITYLPNPKAFKLFVGWVLLGTFVSSLAGLEISVCLRPAIIPAPLPKRRTVKTA